MTEDEAKTKWCPFARQVSGTRKADGDIQVTYPQAALNRIDLAGEAETIAGTKCIASACMAWRTRDRYRDCEERRATQSPGPDWLPADGEPGLWLLAKYEPDGFCGLAGAPQ